MRALLIGLITTTLHFSLAHHFDAGTLAQESGKHSPCFSAAARITAETKQATEVKPHADTWAKLIRGSGKFYDDDWNDRSSTVSDRLYTHAERKIARVISYGTEQFPALLDSLHQELADINGAIDYGRSMLRAGGVGIVGTGLLLGAASLYFGDTWSYSIPKTLTSFAVSMILPVIASFGWREYQKNLRQIKHEQDTLRDFLDTVDCWDLDGNGKARVAVVAVYSVDINLEGLGTVTVDLVIGAEKGQPLRGALFSSLK